MERPVIYDYEDVARFLTDWFAWKTEDRKVAGLPPYSHRMFARDAGLSSSGTLLKVMQGQSRPTPAIVAAVAQALNLDEADTRCLGLVASREEATRALERCRQAYEAAVEAIESGAATDRRARGRVEAAAQALAEAQGAVELLTDQITGARRMYRAAALEADRLHFGSNWYTPVLMDMAGCRGFRWDPDWIAERLGGGVTGDQIRGALALLEELKILYRTAEGEVVRVNEPLITTDPLPRRAVGNLYRGMYERGGEALRRGLDDQNFALRCRLGMQIVPLPMSAIPRMREGLLHYRTQLFTFFEGLQQGEPDVVYQVWVHAFPLFDPLTDDGDGG